MRRSLWMPPILDLDFIFLCSTSSNQEYCNNRNKWHIDLENNVQDREAGFIIMVNTVGLAIIQTLRRSQKNQQQQYLILVQWMRQSNFFHFCLINILFNLIFPQNLSKIVIFKLDFLTRSILPLSKWISCQKLFINTTANQLNLNYQTIMDRHQNVHSASIIIDFVANLHQISQRNHWKRSFKSQNTLVQYLNVRAGLREYKNQKKKFKMVKCFITIQVSSKRYRIRRDDIKHIHFAKKRMRPLQPLFELKQEQDALTSVSFEEEKLIRDDLMGLSEDFR